MVGLPRVASKLKLAVGLCVGLGAAGLSACIQPTLTQASLRVVASVGGTLSVTAANDPTLAGASVTIPPEALAQDTTVTLTLSAASVALPGDQSLGPVVSVGPPGTVLRAPVTLTLPFALDGGEAAASLFALEVDPAGGHELFQHSVLAIDQSSGILGLLTLSFGSYGVVAGTACGPGSSCGTSQVCCAGVCSGALASGVNLGCGSDLDCLGRETCDAGVCVDGG